MSQNNRLLFHRLIHCFNARNVEWSFELTGFSFIDCSHRSGIRFGIGYVYSFRRSISSIGRRKLWAFLGTTISIMVSFVCKVSIFVLQISITDVSHWVRRRPHSRLECTYVKLMDRRKIIFYSPIETAGYSHCNQFESEF